MLPKPRKDHYICVFITCLHLAAAVDEIDDAPGGWYTDTESRLVGPGPCNIEIRDASSLSRQEFLSEYAYKSPIIIRGGSDNTVFADLVSREKLLEIYGSKIIRLSSANTHSYKKVDVSLNEYVEKYLKPQSLDCLGNETMYWFGDNDHAEWGDLFDVYKQPPYHLPRLTGAYSFGLAGAGTGVPFHFHGPGFAEVIHGRKRWFLYPPSQEPRFNGDISNLKWVIDNYPKLATPEMPFECTIGPGEVIYFPDKWWHATLNLDTSVFISTFLG